MTAQSSKLQVNSLPALSQDQVPCLAPSSPRTLEYPELSWQRGKKGPEEDHSLNYLQPKALHVTSPLLMSHCQELVIEPTLE